MGDIGKKVVEVISDYYEISAERLNQDLNDRRGRSQGIRGSCEVRGQVY